MLQKPLGIFKTTETVELVRLTLWKIVEIWGSFIDFAANRLSKCCIRIGLPVRKFHRRRRMELVQIETQSQLQVLKGVS